jgi:DNA-binding NarL/FixJ family response regulator
MNPQYPVKILIVDDHHIFNDGLKSLINAQPDLLVCGQVFHAKDLLISIDQQRPHLVLLDVNLHGANGIELGSQILSAFFNVRVIVLTMYNQPKLLDEARKAGLHGYLLKDATTAKLLQAIKIVISGENYFDLAVLNQMQNSQNSFKDSFAQRLNLTFREVEIIKLIKIGFTNEQIATQLNLSFFTIKTHRKNIYFKLDLNNVAELVDFAMKNGL